MRTASLALLLLCVLGAAAAPVRSRQRERLPEFPDISGAWMYGYCFEQDGRVLKASCHGEQAEGWIADDGTITLLWHNGCSVIWIQTLRLQTDGVLRGDIYLVDDPPSTRRPSELRRPTQREKPNRVGGGITSPVLPHHRTYSAYPEVSIDVATAGTARG